MAGGACFSPCQLVDGQRPFHLYPPAASVASKALIRLLRAPLVPTACGVACWPAYEASAGWWRRADPGLGEAGFLALALAVTINVVYFAMHALFGLVEYNSWLEEHRLGRRDFQLPDRQLVLATLRQTLVGHFLLVPVAAYFILYRLLNFFGSPAFDAPRPSVLTTYFTFMLSMLCNDFFFYWSHRALHAKALYGAFHKQHHTYKGTVSYAAEYAHPVEQLVSNHAPTLLGCVLLGSHYWVLLLWLGTRLRDTYEAHSGYALRYTWLERLGLLNWELAAGHDFHHTGNCGNFGAIYLDWLFGTMDAFVLAGGPEGYAACKAGARSSYLRPGAAEAAGKAE